MAICEGASEKWNRYSRERSGMENIMSHIVYGTEKIRAYDGLARLCEYAGKESAWCDGLWQEMLQDGELYAELVYYLEHHAPADRMKVQGYSLTDLYVWQMEKYNLRRDSGKNTESCNKEEMILQALWTMAKMKKEPEKYVKNLNAGAGMDKL